MANYVNKINAKCRGEVIEEDESIPITKNTIGEGKKLSPPIETKKQLLTSAPTKNSFGKSVHHEDDISEYTPDTDTISTDFSNSRLFSKILMCLCLIYCYCCCCCSNLFIF